MSRVAPWHLIAYDIRNPRRLRRVQYRIAKRAIAVQQSVYLFQGDADALDGLLDLLARYMDRHVDDLRAYPIEHPDALWMHGQRPPAELVIAHRPERSRPRGGPIAWLRSLFHDT